MDIDLHLFDTKQTIENHHSPKSWLHDMCHSLVDMYGMLRDACSAWSSRFWLVCVICECWILMHRLDLKHGSKPTQMDVLRPTKMHLQLRLFKRHGSQQELMRVKDVEWWISISLPATYALFRHVWYLLIYHFASGHAATCRGSCRKSCILVLLAPGWCLRIVR